MRSCWWCSAVTGVAPSTLSSAGWAVGISLGLALGVAIAIGVDVAIIAVAAIVLGIVFVMVRVRAELVVAAYWVTFTLVSTIFVDSAVDQLFYPFYGALLLGVLAAVARGGLRLERWVAWVYGAFLVALIISLVGSDGPSGAAIMRQLIVYPFGALIWLQFSSIGGVRTVVTTAIGTSLTVSAWVIISAVQGDFAYRGSVTVDQNIVSFFIGIGFVLLLAGRLGGRRIPMQGYGTLLAWVGLAAMAYALLLLASRGTMIAIFITVLALLLRESFQRERRLGVFAALILVAAAGFALPGGQGLLDRFEDVNVATGGGRTLIWSVLGSEIQAAGVAELVVGHGFGASREFIGRQFTGVSSPHNAYLQVFFDLGAIGLGLFLVLHGFVVARAWRMTGSDGARILALVVFLLAVNLFITAQDGFLYWTAFGLALAMSSWHSGRAPASRQGATR